MYQDDFCVRNCELLSRRFLQKSPNFLAYYTFLRQFHYFSQIIFCPVWISFTSRPWANIRGGRGQGRKPKLREERRNERHKSSENAQEK